MRHARLHAAAHGVAQSLASGLSFLGGLTRTSVLGDVGRDGPLGVDLLVARITEGVASEGTAAALAAIDLDAHFARQAPPVWRAMYDALSLRFDRDENRLRCDVHLSDHEGRRSARRYAGPDLHVVDAPDSPGGWLIRPGR